MEDLFIGPMRVAGIDYLDDNYDEALADFPVMPARCADCAYTAGTQANMTPPTRHLAEECAKARHGFWCHKSRKAGICTILCAGWHEKTTSTGEGGGR